MVYIGYEVAQEQTLTYDHRIEGIQPAPKHGLEIHRLLLSTMIIDIE